MKFFTAFTALIAAPMLVTGAAVDLEARQVGLLSTTPPALTDRTWITNTLRAVNKYRTAHGAVPYLWNAAQATYSLNVSKVCSLTHSHGPYSENIYWTSATSLNFTQATQDAMDAWMNEQPLYTDPNNPYQALHYTALMWKASTRIGCAWSTTCAPGGFYFFCEMDPQGNVLTQFQANVQN